MNVKFSMNNSRHRMERITVSQELKSSLGEGKWPEHQMTVTEPGYLSLKGVECFGGEKTQNQK